MTKQSRAPPASSLPTPQPPTHLASTMSLKYGLNLKKAAPPKRKTILDDEPDDDEEDDNVLQKGVAEESIDSFGAADRKSVV